MKKRGLDGGAVKRAMSGINLGESTHITVPGGTGRSLESERRKSQIVNK